MNRTFGTWLLCQYILSALLITSVKSSSNAEYCKCTLESCVNFKYMYECKLPFVPDSKITVGMNVNNEVKKVNMKEVDIITINCWNNNKPDYIELIKNLSVRGTEKVKYFEIYNCSIPNVPFVEIFNVFKATNVTYLELISAKITSDLKESHFEGLSNLKLLHLKKNFDHLPETVFNKIPTLVELQIINNPALKSLPSGIFEQLKQLTNLNLSENNLSSVDGNIFKSMPKLKELYLHNNKLVDLPGSAFSNLTELTKLTLHTNKIQTLNDGTFDDLKQLQDLSLHENELLKVPEKPFINNSNLKSIRMEAAFHENFTGLPSEFFANLKMLKLLYLDKNHLSHLPAGLFRNLTSLRQLRLNFNKISQLDDKLFYDLVNLQQLYLRGNNLTLFTTNHMNGLLRLTHLDLSMNKLTMENDSKSLYSTIDRCCENLENLILSDNLVTRVFEDWTFYLPALKKLDLSNNRISSLKTEDFHFRESTTTDVIFKNNTITSININEAELDKYKRKTSITFDIGRNPLKCDCNALSLAQYLHLLDSNKTILIKLKADELICDTHYRLKQVPINNISSLTEFKCSISEGCPEDCDCYTRPYDTTIEVNCTSKNQIEFPNSLPKVPEGYGVELLYTNNNLTSTRGLQNLIDHDYNVTTIALSHNRLEQFDVNELPKGLKVMELHNNNLKYLNGTIFGQGERKDFTNLTFHENPWECNCALSDLWNFIDRTKSLIDNSKIKCNDDRPFSKLSIEDFCSHSNTYILICVSLAILGLLIATVTVLYYKFEQEIRVLMFKYKICLWLVSEEVVDKDKPYDAFVSYSQKDEHFVRTVLVPGLENNGEYNYKLCVHYRDFKVGEFIPSQVVQSVENSRRTIIILSPHFLKSVWGRMEFRTAHLKAIKEGCARVIIIMLEDVTREKLDPELKTYITMNTYVECGDPLFWDKLKYALPHPQRIFKKKYKHAEPEVCLKLYDREKEAMQASDG
ncbi:protein toll-like [Planococcus citri]|uniref:protein toll-like n=1 Tax=Planococcus citri TaxID=170843 RepID=UPI0031FA0ED9